MRGHVHVFVQNPDDHYPAFFRDINDQVLFIAVNAHRRLKLMVFSAKEWRFRQMPEPLFHAGKIAAALFLASLLLRIKADVADIGLSLPADAVGRHQRSSSSDWMESMLKSSATPLSSPSAMSACICAVRATRS